MPRFTAFLLSLLLVMLVLNAVVVESAAKEKSKKGRAFLEKKEKETGVLKTSSGLLYKVLVRGKSNVHPKPANTVKVHYRGTLIDGKEFDSSYSRGPASFGVSQVIPGWTEGLQLMTPGDQFEFYIPSKLGYGTQGAGGTIPPNSVLVFKVELLKIEPTFTDDPNFLKNKEKEDGIVKTKSGLLYKVNKRGTSNEKPEPTNIVKVHYQGTFTNGKEFDSSYRRGEPIEFGVNQVIPGWTEGLQLMSPGDEFNFFIPSHLGYGPSGAGETIPPNSILVFKVELLEIKKTKDEL